MTRIPSRCEERQAGKRESVKAIDVLLKGAEREDQVDATIRVADIDPRRLERNASTTRATRAPARSGWARFQHSNVFDRDHVLTAQFITSPPRSKTSMSLVWIQDPVLRPG